MVMEVSPSPQSVGRELVRQYYTLLNKAPNHLHRFYNQQSSFVHGGLDPPNRETTPVIGQKQIHQKIQQLNFHDCHAKITQVDSQATLGGGVVVQVTGELSNGGQPMRRFTQTFVLAAQSPKKFYVHNDIFRYQDEIISDEECENENRSETEEEINNDCQVMGEVQQISQPPMAFYNNTSSPLQPAIPAVPHLHNQQLPHVLGPQAVPTVNGAVHPDDINVMAGQVASHVANVPGQNISSSLPPVQPNLGASTSPAPIEENIEIPPEDNNAGTYDTGDSEQEQQDYGLDSSMQSNEPKTYANLLKSSGAPFSSPPQQIIPVQPVYQPRPQSPVSSNPGGGFNQGGNRNNNMNMNRGGNRGNQQQQLQQQQQQQQQPRIPRQDSFKMQGRNNYNDESGDDSRRRNQSYDVNQLFLGNLPLSATEDELRDIFIDFGPISDLRVHIPNNKNGNMGIRATPNYGFITFETQQGVQNCLSAKPIFYPKDDKSGTILNVEEKKMKDRQSFGGNRLMNDNRNRDRNNGPRRGPPMGGGPGGPNRNNQGGPGGNGGPPPRDGGGFVGNRPNSFNRNGPPNRGPNTYNNNNRR